MGKNVLPILITGGIGLITGGFGGLVLGLIVGSLSLFLPKPKQQKPGREVADAIVTNTQRNFPVPVVFGRGRLGGTLIVYPAAPGAIHSWGTRLDDNGGTVYVGHFILAICEGPLDNVNSIGNYRQEGRPVFEYFQELVDKKIEPEYQSGTAEEKRRATFYFDVQLGRHNQTMPPMLLDQDDAIAAGRADYKTSGFIIDNGAGEPVYAGSHMPLVPWQNTVIEACQLYLGHNYSHLPSTTRDVVGPDLTLRSSGSGVGSSTGDTAGEVIGYDSYSETFFWTIDSSSSTSSPYGIARIHRAGGHGYQHTPPPDSVSSSISIGAYLGRHDIVVMQDPSDSNLWHVGQWGIARDSDLWERVYPAIGQVHGGYANPVLAQHMDEYHGILHTLHDDGETLYILRWTLLSGRVERLNIDVYRNANVLAMCYSPDLHDYIMAIDDGDGSAGGSLGLGALVAVGAETGETVAVTNDVDITGTLGLAVSGTRVVVQKNDGVEFWDVMSPETAFAKLGGDTTGFDEGQFGGAVAAAQNTYTGHITVCKADSGTVAFINYMASVLEEVEDISAMGTPGQEEFQRFWDNDFNLKPVIGQTFSWDTGSIEEPFFRKVDPPDSTYVRTSGNVTLSIPAGADRLSFGAGSVLDDILIMIKQDESVEDDWDGETERPTVTFSIPSNSIIVANTHGSYMSEEDGTYYATCPKVFDDGDHTLNLPDGSLDPETVDNYQALIDAGFDVEFFDEGISVATLQAKGFISGGQLRCKLVHIVCGRGRATVDRMGFVANQIPDADPDTVGGWVRDWSWRTYDSWSLTQLEGKSSLAAAIWNALVQVKRNDDGEVVSADEDATWDTARWGAGQSADYFAISSFEHLHSRCVAGWRYANKMRAELAGSGTIGSASAMSSASGAIVGPVTFVQTYRYAERYKLDFVLDTPTGASELITAHMLACCGGFRYMVGDKLHVGIPLAGAFPAWHFQDEVINDDSVKVSFVGRTATINRVRVQFREVRDESRINIAQADVEFEQNRTGRVTERDLTLSGIARRGQAELVATQTLNEAVTQRRGIEFGTSFLGYAVGPTDIIEITYRSTGLSRTKAKVIKLQERQRQTLEITATEHKHILAPLGLPQPGPSPVGSVGSDVGSDQVPGECEEQTGSTGSGVRWFNGGAVYAPGCYDLFYVDNAYKLTNGPGGYAVEGYDVVTRDADNTIRVLLAAPAVPNPPDGWGTAEEAVLANSGQSERFTLEGEGPIGLRLREPPKFTNFGDLGPAPTYQLCLCEELESGTGGGEAACDMCWDAPEADDDVEEHLDTQWGTVDRSTEPNDGIRWYINDGGAQDAAALDIENAMWFAPGFYAIEYKGGAYRRIDGSEEKWFAEGFVLRKWDLVDGYNAGSVVAPTTADPDEGYDSLELATEASYDDGTDEGSVRFFKLENPSKLGLQFGTGSDETAFDAANQGERPHWEIRCMTCDEIYRKVGDDDTVPGLEDLTDLVLCPPKKKLTISGFPAPWGRLNGEFELELQLTGGDGRAKYFYQIPDANVTFEIFIDCATQKHVQIFDDALGSSTGFHYYRPEPDPGDRICYCPENGLYKRKFDAGLGEPESIIVSDVEE